MSRCGPRSPISATYVCPHQRRHFKTQCALAREATSRFERASNQHSRRQLCGLSSCMYSMLSDAPRRTPAGAGAPPPTPHSWRVQAACMLLRCHAPSGGDSDQSEPADVPAEDARARDAGYQYINRISGHMHSASGPRTIRCTCMLVFGEF